LAGRIEEADCVLQQEEAEVARAVQEHEKSALLFCRRLIAIVRVVLDEKKTSIPDTGWHGIILSILTKVIATVRAAHALGAAGHAREVSILVRSALESLITAMFIAKEDSSLRAKRWRQFADVQRAALLKKKPDPSLAAPEYKAERRRILARARRLKKHFPSKSFWAAGLKKGSLRDLVEDVGLLWYYEIVYWSGSLGTHGSAIAVASYVGTASDGTPVFKTGLSVQDLRAELAVCCDLLVRSLVMLNRLYKLGLDKLFGELVSEYKAAFGGDPLGEMAEG